MTFLSYDTMAPVLASCGANNVVSGTTALLRSDTIKIRCYMNFWYCDTIGTGTSLIC